MRTIALKTAKFLLVFPAFFSGFFLISMNGFLFGVTKETAFYAGVGISTAAVFVWIKWMTRTPVKKELGNLNEFVTAQEIIHQFITAIDWAQKDLIISESHLPWSKARIKKSITLYAKHLKRRGHLDPDNFDLCKNTYGALAFFVGEGNFKKDLPELLAAIPQEKERLEKEFERLLGME
jgi:hypothetical protein